MKLLVIDDDPIVVELLNGMLSSLGYSDVESALDGKLALHQLTKVQDAYDCILMDIRMPDLSGIELCRILRANLQQFSIPIVMLTALADQASIDQAFRAGATDYINKPIDVVDLDMRLRKVALLNRKRRGMTVDQLINLPFRGENIEPGEHILIDDVDDLVDYAALCNYLAHLSHSGLESRQVIAVQLHDYRDICARSSLDELNFILTEVADTISQAFHEHNCFLSYYGEGAFVVVTDKSELEPSVHLEMRIMSNLKKLNLEHDNGDHVDLALSISNPIRPNTSKTKRVRNTFDRAVSRVRSRIQRKSTTRSPQDWSPGFGLRVVGSPSTRST